MSATKSELELLKEEIEKLQKENNALKKLLSFGSVNETVFVPEKFKPIFDKAELTVKSYFTDTKISPENANIEINGERYVLMRAAALSFEFWDVLKELYSNYNDDEATHITTNFLFDIAHVLGIEDAKAFHKRMNLSDPIAKLSAGPVHFAYTGWANVEILPESNPVPDENYFIKFYHHNSFEAQSWLKASRKSDVPVCTMNCGYSSGWCEESFGLALTAIEIACEAQGAQKCTFIMAPPHRINEYLEIHQEKATSSNYDVPVFFERKYNEDKLKQSLLQKETLLKEVHHRVKNNLQVISSLLNLQLNNLKDSKLRAEFYSSISRVNTMARIHELIYGDHNVSSIHIEKYFKNLLRALYQLYHTNKEISLSVTIEVKHVVFSPDKAIPLGLVLNEIASNSFKHAFKNDSGEFSVRLVEFDDKYQLICKDNGSGLPENYSNETLGLSLIPILCEQIDAQLEIINSPNGLEYRITFDR